jgi:hypothetical protein
MGNLEQVPSDPKLSRYEQALRDIIDPIAAMRRDLPPGYSLDGHAAVRAADNPETYKNIARKALGDKS